jgi:hypothetical protein
LDVILRAALTVLLIIRTPWLHVGDFSQTVVGEGAFQVAEIRFYPHKLNLNSQIVLQYDRQRVESLNPREFACYRHMRLRYSQGEDTFIATISASMHDCEQTTVVTDLHNPS